MSRGGSGRSGAGRSGSVDAGAGRSGQARAGAVRTRDGALARKRFGQHYLVDRSIIQSIVEAIAPRAGDRLVEIGPGTGALTTPLLQAIEAVHQGVTRKPANREPGTSEPGTSEPGASESGTSESGTSHAAAGAEPTGDSLLEVVEIDRDLADRIETRFGSRVLLHRADALAFDFGAGSVDDDRPLRVVGNLPYNISSPLLMHLAQWAHRVRDQHFMLQREVVERIVANPGPQMGRLTVALQNVYEVIALFDVPPSAFEPPPNVDSAVIRMIPRKRPLCAHPGILAPMLVAAFGQRRKMLRNTLLPWLGQHHPAKTLAEWIAGDPELAAFDDPRIRAEQVPVSAWCRLADRLAAPDQASTD